MKELDEVMIFHKEILQNRRKYLSTELERLDSLIKKRDNKIEFLAKERSDILQILKTHGALDEYSNILLEINK